METLTKPLTQRDREILGKLKDQAWFKFLRLYVPLFLCLAFVYYEVLNSGGGRSGYGHPRVRVSREELNTVFPYFAGFFSIIFLIFLVKDFRRLILPFMKEIRQDQKVCLAFYARKYRDPLYGKFLLFYPDKEDYYISVSAEDFDSIGNGQELDLEIASVTGEVLSLKSGDRSFKDPSEFSFSEITMIGRRK